ncbi:MAG: subclass B1 metallo-beta-lactamase [Candidatus Delongbacteria bacterium]|nr:subclass B1 metallo-beta-lactamase [Candidatus Delongbacteria bacterium]
MRSRLVFFLLVVLQSGGLLLAEPGIVKINSDLEIIRISDHAFIHQSCASLPKFGRFSSNGLILVDHHQALLLDTPVTDSLTRDLVSWIEDSLHARLTGFVPNHWHDDCMGGLGFLQSHHVKSYANQMTIEIAESRNIPVPDSGFQDSLRLQVGEISVLCYYPGAAHSMDNIVVWIPSEKILFAGCMVKSIDSKSLGNTVDGDLRAYPETLDRVAAKFHDAQIVIPGHGAWGGMELIRHTRRLIP